MSTPPLRQTASPDEAGTRLDRVVATWEGVNSRTRAARLIEDGLVTVNGKPERAAYLVCEGDDIEVRFPEPKVSTLVPYDLPLTFVHEDDDVLVVDKPAGLVVHPASGHEGDTLVNALLAQTKNLSMGFGEQRPGIVHRLDKDTSGLLVIAKNNEAQDSLVKQFQARSVHRVYQALVFGDLRPASGTIESNLARHPNDRLKFASIAAPAGKPAITDYRTLSKAHGLSFLEVRLRTGRTHQIRVHLSEKSNALVGDLVYGSERRLKSLASVKLREDIARLDRFFLHARELGFTHPRTGERLNFEIGWPERDRAWLQKWGFET